MKQTALQELSGHLMNPYMDSEEGVVTSNLYQINRVNTASRNIFWPIAKPSSCFLQNFHGRWHSCTGIAGLIRSCTGFGSVKFGNKQNITTDNYYTSTPPAMELKPTAPLKPPTIYIRAQMSFQNRPQYTLHYQLSLSVRSQYILEYQLSLSVNTQYRLEQKMSLSIRPQYTLQHQLSLSVCPQYTLQYQLPLSVRTQYILQYQLSLSVRQNINFITNCLSQSTYNIH